MATEVGHGQGDEGVGACEPERRPSDEPDLCVDRLDQAVGQVVLDRGKDGVAVGDDGPLELDEAGDPAAAGPADPGVQGGGTAVTAVSF